MTNKKTIILLHSVLIIFIWISPFLLNWKLIILGIILQTMHSKIFKGCILTNWQFKEKAKEMTFYTFILEKIGFNINKKKMRFISANIFPVIILLLAITYQIILKNSPWII